MFYPKADCCPYNSDETIIPAEKIISKMQDAILENESNMSGKCEMMRKIQETDFAIIDLNLFLDTHPNCSEALELFTKLAATSKSLKNDYQSKYGPLYVEKSSANTPFEWVDKCRKWPWEM